MALEDYTTGTVLILNGSATLTGSGTAWDIAPVSGVDATKLKGGDTFYQGGYAVLIKSVDSDTQITLQSPWPGPSLSGASYVIRFQPDNSRMQGTTRELLDRFRAGLWIEPDAKGVTADKANYDDKSKGFTFLDFSVDPQVMYTKLSDTSGDWSAGSNQVGPQGQPGADGNADGGRAMLTANRTYYVATTGSDSNDGLTSGTAFATPQKAVTTAFATLDLNGHNVTIQLADGTYASTVTQTSAQVGAGTIKLRGNTAMPGNVLFSLAAQTAIAIDGYGTKLAVEGIRLAFSGNGIGLAVTNGAYLTVTGNMDFGPALWHTRVDGLSTLRFAANYTISGSAARHYFVGTNSKLDTTSRTVTLTGTPAFSDAFAYAELSGVMFGPIMTFSGSATGSRYQAKNGGIINSGGGGASYFPGSTAGTGTNMGTSPYGLYL